MNSERSGDRPRSLSLAATRDAVIRDRAARQHGVVARGQLIAAGVPSHAIDHRVRSGRLTVLHRGVYQVGPVVAPLAAEMAAVLACGSGAVLSHDSAARLWKLAPSSPENGVMHVSVEDAYRVRGPGLRVHRVARLDPAERTVVAAIPTTTPARTILDLAGSTPARELERMLAIGEREGIVAPDDVAGLLTANARRRGMRRLRRILAREEGPALTRSDAEAILLQLVRSAALPPPIVNARVGRLEVDFLWRAERLVVEVDGFAHHGTRAAFERDRERDAALMTRGYRVLRVTWRQLHRDRDRTLARLAQALVPPGSRP